MTINITRRGFFLGMGAASVVTVSPFMAKASQINRIAETDRLLSVCVSHRGDDHLITKAFDAYLEFMIDEFEPSTSGLTIMEEHKIVESIIRGEEEFDKEYLSYLWSLSATDEYYPILSARKALCTEGLYVYPPLLENFEGFYEKYADLVSLGVSRNPEKWIENKKRLTQSANVV